MTGDYKKILLDYITGNLEKGTPTTEELYQNTEKIDRSKYIGFMPERWADFRIYGIIKSKTNDKVILYGGYVEYGGTYTANSKGIIIITDQELKPIQTIYNFSSGTELRPIQCMYQEEDGEFIAIDSTILYSPGYASQSVYQALVTNPKRVIMLNDVSSAIDGEYQVNLRRSYALNGVYTNFICKNIFKNPNTSHYIFFGTRIVYKNNKYDPDGCRAIELKINVGSANEWGVVDTGDDFLYGGTYAYFDNEDIVHWKMLITSTIGGISNSGIFVWNGTGTTAPPATLIQGYTTYRPYIDSDYFPNQVAFINENKAYYVMNNQRWGVTGTAEAKYIGLYEVDLSTNTLNQRYLKYIGNYDHTNQDTMQLQVVNGELYIFYIDNVSTSTANYYEQRYTGIWNPILVGENENYSANQRTTYVSQTFNVLNLYIIPINYRPQTWYMKVITEIYNQSNYNGESYNDYNSLIAKYGNIYSNDKLVFSRNLHNLSITNNYTIASIEVPNTYLNDMDLNPKDLVGETNCVLVEDGKTISKNIYEVLYLNYINTISVKDNENEIISATGRYINANINVGTEENQSNSKCTKIRINYQDNTNAIRDISWNLTDDTHKYCEFSLYINKPISNIEFISNDESTTYITIERELEIEKYYTFKQYLKVE